MFLRCNKRRKDGKEHLYWTTLENHRFADSRILQRPVLYLGELNGIQEATSREAARKRYTFLALALRLRLRIF